MSGKEILDTYEKMVEEGEIKEPCCKGATGCCGGQQEQFNVVDLEKAAKYVLVVGKGVESTKVISPGGEELTFIRKAELVIDPNDDISPVLKLEIMYPIVRQAVD